MQDSPSPSTIINTIMSSAQEHCINNDTIESNDKNKKIKSQSQSNLLPGLPNHLAEICLSNLQPSLLYGVCTSWRRFIYSPSFPPFFSLYALFCQPSPTIPSTYCVQSQCQPDTVSFFSLDPFSTKWKPLPNPAPVQPLCLIRKHPSFISRTLSIQTVTASGHLVLIAATTHKFLPGLSHPLVFDPITCKWYSGPPFSTPRRWCAVGAVDGEIYMGTGTGAHYHADVARSLEKWDMSKKDWERCSPFKDGRFSREAVTAVGFRGKLCMVNVNGKAVKEGIVYDVVMDKWEDMPPGMLTGWNGPATADDDDGDVMYVVNQENGSLLRYGADDGQWVELIDHCEFLKGAVHISACRGKVCAVSADGLKIVMADTLARPVKIWSVDPPQGMETVSVHILPRMSMPEY